MIYIYLHISLTCAYLVKAAKMCVDKKLCAVAGYLLKVEGLQLTAEQCHTKTCLLKACCHSQKKI